MDAQNVPDVGHFLYSIWLFSRSDTKTMVLPVCMFGVLSALAGRPVTPTSVSLAQIVGNLPQLLLWTWLNILVLSISNQRSPESIEEDKLNNPWRPIVSGRISPDVSRQVLLYTVPALILLGATLGLLTETLACLCGNWLYNDLGGADEHFLIRNVVNGVAYLAYGPAAIKLAAGFNDLPPESYAWVGMVALVVGTTIQLQDLKDLEGDAARGRHTAPVVLGPGITRWSVCVGVTAWSLICPLYWHVAAHRLAVFVMTGIALSSRVLLKRSSSADRTSFILWSWWMMGIFLLPVMGNR